MGQSPLVTITLHFGGSAPYNFLHWPCFSKCIDLASNMFCIAMINYLLLYGNGDSSNCLLYFISTKLKYHISVWLQLGHDQKMDVVAKMDPC